jgi:steroid delta-isomerase-like uncharacterized protein
MNATIRDLAAQWFERVWNQKDASAISDLFAPDAVGHTEGGSVKGPAEFVELMHRPMLAAFPDIRLIIEGILVEGNQAVARWQASATHSGPFANIPPSGRPVTFSGMTWLRFENGKIVEGSDRYNLHSLIAYLSTGQVSATVKAI